MKTSSKNSKLPVPNPALRKRRRHKSVSVRSLCVSDGSTKSILVIPMRSISCVCFVLYFLVFLCYLSFVFSIVVVSESTVVSLTVGYTSSFISFITYF